MPTPASGDTPYCTVDQLKANLDVRPICQLLSDDNAPVSPSSLGSNAYLAELMKEASGLVESAATVAGAYTITPERNDLAALTGNSASLLAGLVAHVTFWLLFNRRPNLLVVKELPPLTKMYLEFLEDLRLGKRILGMLDAQRAGRLCDTLQTISEVQARRGPVQVASRLFGTRVAEGG